MHTQISFYLVILTEASRALIAGMMSYCYPFDAAQRKIAKTTRFFRVPCIMPVRPSYPLIVQFFTVVANRKAELQ
jgi:hypothetical protein